MTFKRALKVSSLVAGVIIPTALTFNNCSQGFIQEGSESGLSSSSCAPAPSGLRNPQTIDQTVALINSLPKPLTLDCFLQSLGRPLNVFALHSTFSAQASESELSPRIFILKPGLSLSVVPTGAAKAFLELGQFLSSTESVKGEIEFPVNSQLIPAAPYDHILKANGGGTNCSTCHIFERQAFGDFGGPAFASAIMAPDPFKRITSQTLYEYARFCNETQDAYRCAILKSIFLYGQGRDGNFP